MSYIYKYTLCSDYQNKQIWLLLNAQLLQVEAWLQTKHACSSTHCDQTDRIPEQSMNMRQ